MNQYLHLNISRQVGRLLFLALFMVGLSCVSSQSILAATCTQTATDTAEIQTLIDDAANGDVICVPVGTHRVNLILKTGVTLQGLELARIFLESATAGTPTVTGAANSTVQNLTIRGNDIGISANNITTDFTISNVIIATTSTGIDCNSSNITVSNAVLSGNTTAINCRNSSNLTLNNTIIVGNTTDLEISANSTDISNNNLLFNNVNENYPPDDSTSVFDDPLFVDPANNDYHLKIDSPAIDAGAGTDIDTTAADIGAYGGADADVTPFLVSGPGITVEGPDAVTLLWRPNEAYNITGYNVYFDTDVSGEPYEGVASEGNSPVNTNLLTQALTSLVVPPTNLTVPTGLVTVPGDKTILVSWSAVTGATGYHVSYGTSSGIYTSTIDAGNSTSHLLTGLTNDVDVFITVNAYSQPTVYLSVAAVDTSGNQSALVNEVSAVLSSSITTGPASSEVSDFPEATVINPNLEDENKCFIATVAYGSSLEPQVALLRKFRNHFLLTNSPGKCFVDFYYKYSPPVASFISQHGCLKTVVRGVLYPVIGLAWFCLKIGPLFTLFFSLLLIASFIHLRRYWSMKKCV